jgi:hypothetical protein
VQMADAHPNTTLPASVLPTAEASQHSQTEVAARPARRGTSPLRWLLVGVGALSVCLMAIPFGLLMAFRLQGRCEKEPRVRWLVAVSPGRAPRIKKDKSGASPVTIKRRCVACGKGVRVTGGGVGKRFQCPGCRTVQTIRGVVPRPASVDA